MMLTAKGAARRGALLDATLRVLEHDGVSAVTHRAVAAEAGVPVSAATYYFATLDDLFVAALERATDLLLDDLAAVDTGDAPALAAAIHRWVTTERAETIAQYEMLFLAMRRPGLRESADRWYGVLDRGLSARWSRESERRVIVLAIDGLLLSYLWRGAPETVEGVEADLRLITSCATT